MLALDPNVTTMYTVTNTVRLQNGIMNPNFYVNGFINSSVEFQQLTITKEYTERELSSLITEYKIRNGPSTLLLLAKNIDELFLSVYLSYKVARDDRLRC